MDAKTKAQQMLDAVREGKTIFTHGADRWYIVGPASKIKTYEIVAVTKANGETRTVIVGEITGTYEKQGVAYAVATFTRNPEAHPRPRAGYRTVHNAAFGEGRVYHAQPGATQYDDGSGRFAVQIWDDEE